METNELQDMKEQMALLKETLRKEQIVNDRLLREAMCGTVERIHRRAWIGGICALYVLTFGLWSFRSIGLSWWFIGGTVFLMVYSVADTIIIHRRMRTNSIMTDDLRTVAYAAKRMKLDYAASLRRGLVLVFIWLLWLGLEIQFGSTVFADCSETGRLAVLAAMAVGAATGGAIGYKMHRRVLSLCDDIIRQVEE